jgi:hypothetical protein
MSFSFPPCSNATMGRTRHAASQRSRLRAEAGVCPLGSGVMPLAIRLVLVWSLVVPTAMGLPAQ